MKTITALLLVAVILTALPVHAQSDRDCDAYAEALVAAANYAGNMIDTDNGLADAIDNYTLALELERDLLNTLPVEDCQRAYLHPLVLAYVSEWQAVWFYTIVASLPGDHSTASGIRAGQALENTQDLYDVIEEEWN